MHTLLYRNSKKMLKLSSNITTLLERQNLSQVMSAELALVQFIALHNLLFETADHLSDLFRSIFPGSKIAADFTCKHTKTKALDPYCDALDPYWKEPVIKLLQSSLYNLLCDESNERGDLTKL